MPDSLNYQLVIRLCDDEFPLISAKYESASYTEVALALLSTVIQSRIHGIESCFTQGMYRLALTGAGMKDVSVTEELVGEINVPRFCNSSRGEILLDEAEMMNADFYADAVVSVDLTTRRIDALGLFDQYQSTERPQDYVRCPFDLCDIPFKDFSKFKNWLLTEVVEPNKPFSYNGSYWNAVC